MVKSEEIEKKVLKLIMHKIQIWNYESESNILYTQIIIPYGGLEQFILFV